MAQASTSIRQRALERLRDVLGTMVDGAVPATFDAGSDAINTTLPIEHVVFGPLTEAQFKKNFAVGIMEGDLTLAHQMTVDTNLLQVTLEIFARIDATQASAGMTAWNSILTDLHRTLRSDRTLNGLVSNVEMLGNSVDPDSWLDKKIDGAVFLRLNYKTAEDDPRERVPGVIPA